MRAIIILTVMLLLFGCSRPNKQPEKSYLSTSDSSTTYTDNSVTINEEDTFNINGYAIYFSKCKPVQMPELFKDQKTRKQITDTISNSHRAAIAVEKYLKNKFKNYFIADDSNVVLFLENSGRLVLPKWDPAKQFANNFENYFEKENYFLIYNQYDEGNDWTLINRKNGFQKGIGGRPYFSPNGLTILAINSDLFGISTNEIELLSVSGDSLITRFRIEIKGWGPSGVKWINETEAILEKRFYTRDSSTNKIVLSKSFTRIAIKQDVR